MTQSFALDNRNDLTLAPDGRLKIATGLEAVLYACQNAVQTVRGECPLDVERGLPNFETVWGGSPNLAQFEAAARSALNAVPGVVTVQSFVATISNGTVSFVALIETEFGTENLNG